MLRIIVLLLLPSAVTCMLEMGEEQFFPGRNKTFTYVNRRTIFENTNVKVSVECTNGSVIALLSVQPMICLVGNDTEKEKINRRIESKGVRDCHSFPEDFNISSFPNRGVYMFNFTLVTSISMKSVTLRFGSEMNFLSPKDYPLFVFYSVMCVVYAVYAMVWLVLCCCHWKELLRIQFWIGGVILLGMLEKAMFVGEYDTVRRTGLTTGSMLIAAEVVSSLKRTLSRMLVIIVSLGFGIVKPRLGAALHKVTLVGIAFFVVSCTDGVVRSSDEEYAPRVVTILRFLLSITDAIIFLWIFYSIVKTISLLTLRKNLVKLSLYRHFRNVLIFSVLASIAFMAGIYLNNNFYDKDCPWERMLDEEWWEDAFWSLLFSIILFSIIILWRPSANNQRYAYSPLHDLDEDEIDQLNECTNEGLGVSKRGNENGDNMKKSTKNEDDDLKWVEENIPKSIIDSALSNLVESDEEINQKKFEISKML